MSSPGARHWRRSNLRRVALITAMAECLQSQGVPMPNWMRDYPAKRVPTPKDTPALVAQENGGQKGAWLPGQLPAPQPGVTHMIYGGASTGAATKDIHIVERAEDADRLVPVLKQALAQAPLAAP